MGRISRADQHFECAVMIEPLEGRVLYTTLNLGSPALPTLPTTDVAFVGSAGAKAFFTIDDNVLWSTEGSQDTSVKLHAFTHGPFAPTAAGKKLFFTAVGAGKYGLWSSDGTPAGTVFIAEAGAYDIHYGAVGESLYFISTPNGDPETPAILYKSDGTPQGTRQVVASVPTIGYGAIPMVEARGKLFFLLRGDESGTQLWTSDGTSSGTKRVADVVAPPGAPFPNHTLGFPGYTLTAVGGTVFITIRRHGEPVVDVWTSDGTGAGTRKVTRIDLPADKYGTAPIVSAAIGEKLVFEAATSSTTSLLYVSDGTAAGTKVLTDRVGSVEGSSIIHPPVAVGDRVFFYNRTSRYGSELSTSDGTPEGTRIVKDLTPGADGTLPGPIVGTNGRAFFFGAENYFRSTASIYSTDGTSAGTKQVTSAALTRGNLAFAGESLFFSSSGASLVAMSSSTGSLAYPLAPTASMVASEFTAARGAVLQFTVTYRHTAGLSFRDLYTARVRVTGPNGYDRAAELLAFDSSVDGAPRSAVYAVTPPGGSWNNADKGRYRVHLDSPAARDNAGYVQPRQIGSFLVRPVTSELGTIAGTIFEDADRDRFRDAGESGVPGFRVWIDSDGNGRLGPNEPSTRTDADGAYRFDDVAPGEHLVRQTLVGDWDFVTPQRIVQVLPGGVGAADFAVRYNPRNGIIRGTVFNDWNGNGKQDGNEPGLPGRRVYLDLDDDATRDPNEPLIGTGDDGAYAFTGLEAGSYRLRQFSSGVDWAFTSPKSYLVTLPPNGTSTKDFGHRWSPTGRVTGQVMFDANGDGVIGKSESSDWAVYQLGTAPPPVYIDLNGDGKLSEGEPAAQPDYLGYFTVSGVPAGTFMLRVVPTAGWTDTTPAEVATIRMISGASVSAGLYMHTLAPGLITGRVFDDRNRNNAFTSGEAGMPGIAVYLDANDNGSRDAGEWQVFTDADGFYEFRGLLGGDYIVRLGELPPSYGAVTPVRQLVTINHGGSDTRHFAVSSTSALVGFVYHDLDGNGSRSPEEPVLAGVALYLDLNGNGALDEDEPSGTSVASGSWWLGGLSPGEYTLRVVGYTTTRQVFVAALTRHPLGAFGVR